MIFCLWYFIHALGKVCDSLMVYRSGLLSIISHRSIVQSFTIRYFHYRDVLSIDALRSFSRIWTKRFGRIDRFVAVRNLGEKRWKISGEWNAWKRGYAFGWDFKRGAGRGSRKAGRKRVVPGRRADYHAYTP